MDEMCEMEAQKSKKGWFLSSKRKQKYNVQSVRMALDNPMKQEVSNTEENCDNSSPTRVSESESSFVMSGRRIVELGHLAKQLRCDKCDSLLDLTNTFDEHRYGFGSILHIKCVCGECKQVETSKRHRPEGKKRGPNVFDINTKAALGMYHSGSGHTQITNFMSTIEVPVPHHKSMKKREKEVEEHIAKVAEQSCDNALDEEMELAKANIGPDGVINLEMKYDMGWQKRGSGRAYDSKSGVGTMLGQKTGKVCSCDIRIKGCKTCSLHMNKGTSPPSHTCSKNWTGSSKSMESDVAVKSLQKIEKNKNITIGVLIMDDDTTTMSKIKDTIPHPVDKWSDLNHTRKHLGNALYNLQKTHKCLTTKVIQYLQKCFSYAVNQNKNDSENLTIALQRIVPHVFGHHENCGEWCGYKAKPESYRHKSLPHGKDLIGDELYDDLSRIFESLVKNVEKIAPAASTKDVESFNNKIASKAPKRCHYSGSSSLKNRVLCAVSEKNVGASYVSEVHSSLELSPGKFYSSHAEKKDNVRKRRLVYENTREFKLRRIEKKINSSLKNSQKELREGVTYQSSVGLVDIADNQEIPPPTLPPRKEEILQFDGVPRVFCDTETTGLSKTCDIIQLSAVCDDDVFNQYIFPSKPISRSASQVTGLELHGNSLCHNGHVVNALSLKESLTLFLAWLQERKPCVLIGHNFQAFDFPRIIRAFMLCNMLNSLQECVIGIIDTLPLFREIYPHLNKYNQENLVHQILHDTYSAHNAEADVCSLQKLLNVCNVPLNKLSKFSVTTASSVEIYNFAQLTDRNLQTLSAICEQKMLSKHMALKLSKSGLMMQHLLMAVKRDGYDGLKSVLSEKSNGSPRVTSSKSVIDKIYQYLIKCQ